MSAKWYLGTGAQNDVVISTSIHIARNITQFPFPATLSLQDKLKVNAIVKDAASSVTDYRFNYYEMKMLSQSEVVSLAERHLVSPEFASSRDGRALLLTEDEAVSIMLNEEDHIRLQVMYAGFALDEAYRTAEAGMLLDFWYNNCDENTALFATGDYNSEPTTVTQAVLRSKQFKPSYVISLTPEDRGTVNVRVGHNTLIPHIIDYCYVNTDAQTVLNYYPIVKKFDTDFEGQFAGFSSDHRAIMTYCDYK